MLNLINKKAVITGGSSGIGKSIAVLFAQQGALVYILDMNEAAADATVDEIRSSNGECVFLNCNVTNTAEVANAFKEIGPHDILVNCAGISHIGKADTTSEEDFDRVVNVNIKGVFNCLNAAIPQMKINNGGVIVNLASIAAWCGLADRFAYSATKGAIVSMTLSVAKDYLDDHIRCNSISPARVHTPFVDGFLSRNYPGAEKEMFAKLSATQPIGRMAQPKEIAMLALYLCSNEASFITGCDYPIDGGFIKLNN